MFTSGGWYASRRCRCIAKWANGDGIKIAIAVTGSSCLTIAGAFIIDLLLLALTLFVGQLLSDRLNGNNLPSPSSRAFSSTPSR
ncbi:hypothetical protein J4734_15395 [Klebsiella pneumoniae]|uniref:Uncharacterized protein n=1 Tax=Klebsiella pneumoniae TaxID=573 RepID=A0A939NN63_KLEPN|nr:hypothetical protein [Klebsiella pneumoniae]